ncbi:MAG: protein kinase domain-containing protein, partial [Nannocystaceae bacterium]
MRDDAYKVCPNCDGRANAEHKFCPSCGGDLGSTEVQAGDLWLGTTIEGRYRLDEVIGTGAMGRVYRATQTNLNKSFAVKVLHSHLTNDAASRDRFANEAHNVASLNHPNVVSVIDYGTTPDEMTYLAMEFVEGKSLEAVIAEEYPLARSRIVDLCLQILAALTEAHGLGILHRDLKPENILVKTVKTHGELVKVLDFGIAKLMDDSDQQRPGLTGHGQVCGTPEYMSPEQARGHRLDARSDLYAVGIILYQMLAGRVPFDSQSAVEVLQRHINETPEPPSKVTNTHIGALESVCLKAISKSPDERFASATEFRERLVSALRSSPELVIECTSCGANLEPTARFCASCGAIAPARAGAPTRTRSITQISDMSLPAMSSEAVESSARVAGFPLKLTARAEPVNWMHEKIARPPDKVSFTVFQGARGAGKTRLLYEFAGLANQAEWRVLMTGAEPRAAAPSLWPIRSIVRDSLNISPTNEMTPQLLGRSANLAGLSFEALPGLAELFSLDGPARSAELSVRRRECFSAALEAMTLSGAETPTLILFDDIDRYDAASRTILRRLRHLTTRQPVLVICSTSEEDLSWLDLSARPITSFTTADLQSLERRFKMEEGALQHESPMLPLAANLHLRLARQGRAVPPSEAPDLDTLAQTYLEDRSPLERAILEAAAVYGESIAEDVFEEFIANFFRQQDVRDLDDALANLHVDR